MSEEEIIIANMLIHGHNTDVGLLKLEDKLVDLAVMLAKNDEYEKSDFVPTFVRPKLVLRESELFLRKKFTLHKVSYANELMIKLKLHGKIVKSEGDLLRLYNNVGILINPFNLPVKLVNEPYYYGNVLISTNLSDDAEFLKKMKLFFKGIELGSRTNDMTGVCYVHEIIHTQLESMKGIVGDYYNSELLCIFTELLYAYEKGPILFREALKNRINMFLIEFHNLYNYLHNGKCNSGEDLWDNVIAGKYIVSTVKAFHLFNNYYIGDEVEKNNILWLVQKVIDGDMSLEDMLKELGITYHNSLKQSHVLSLIHSTNIKTS